MECYRVLLVDDEEDIRVGISRKMDWAGLGFSLVGEAGNGQDALELAESLQPDVVLTDIKMPFLDGLELCRILKDRLPAAKFVVFSGFDDFEYAKQAIQMNVFEYILKPINANELSGVLQKLKAGLDRERAELQNRELLRRRYEESLPTLRELFFTHLLDGRVVPGQEEEKARHLELSLPGESWAVALVHIGGDAGEKDVMLALSIQQLLNENLKLEHCWCRSFLYDHSVALIAGFTGTASIYELTGALERVCALGETYLGVTLTIGVGGLCRQLSGLPMSAAGAKNALDYRGMVGRGQAIYIGDLEPDAGVRLTFDENDERTLVSAVKLGGEEEVRLAVKAMVEKVRSENAARRQYNLFFMELLTCLLKMTRSADLSLEEVFGANLTEVMQASDFPTLDTMERWCVDHCLRIQGLIRRQRTDSAGRTVERAREFIRRHYGESELSVERICEYLHLSPAYFSTLFKRETGMSFTACVTMERMEAAANALRNTEEKTYLIARKCGYEDPNYFSYVFKRHFGVSPTKFRGG